MMSNDKKFGGDVDKNSGGPSNPGDSWGGKPVERRKRKSRGRVAAAVVTVVAMAIAALLILLGDDCWPEPEPVPADCKPGDLCPVSKETTGGPEIDPLPAVPATSMSTTTVAPGSETGGTGPG